MVHQKEIYYKKNYYNHKIPSSILITRSPLSQNFCTIHTPFPSLNKNTKKNLTKISTPNFKVFRTKKLEKKNCKLILYYLELITFLSL